MILTYHIRSVGAKGRAKKKTLEVANFDEARQALKDAMKRKRGEPQKVLSDVTVKSKALA